LFSDGYKTRFFRYISIPGCDTAAMIHLTNVSVTAVTQTCRKVRNFFQLS
jgi:hypothetical protein